jgi:hypothetical protein
MDMMCPDCGHWHDGRKCDVLKVGGPQSDVSSRSGYKPEEHTGRTLTRCGCDTQAHGNGASPRGEQNG